MPLDPRNEILPFGHTGVDDIDLTPLSSWATEDQRLRGMQPGAPADQRILNRALRQALHVASAVSEMVCRFNSEVISDDGDVVRASQVLEAALKQLVQDTPKHATEDFAGIIRISTLVEQELGLLENTAVTPAGLRLRLQKFSAELTAWVQNWIRDILLNYATLENLATEKAGLVQQILSIQRTLQNQLDSHTSTLMEILGSTGTTPSANLGPSTVANWQDIVTQWFLALHPDWTSIPLGTQFINQFDGHLWEYNGTLWVDMGASTIAPGSSPRYLVNKVHSWLVTSVTPANTAVDIGLSYSVNRNMLVIAYNGAFCTPKTDSNSSEFQYRELKPSGGFADQTPSDVDTVSTQVMFTFDLRPGDIVHVLALSSNVSMAESLLKDYVAASSTNANNAERSALRAGAYETQAQNYANTCQDAQMELRNKLIHLNKGLVHGVDWVQTPASTIQILKLLDPQTGNETQRPLDLPTATDQFSGLMPSSAVQALESLATTVSGLQAQIRYFVVNLGTDEVSDQDVLTQAYEAANPGVPATDGTTLINMDELGGRGAEYLWVESDSKWHWRGTAAVSVATRHSPGLVLDGDGTTDGTVKVATDGSMSVIGFTEIKNAVASKNADIGATGLSSALPTNNAPGASAQVGTSTRVAREDHQHRTPDFGDSVGLAFGGVSEPGVSGLFARADHTHAVPELPVATFATELENGAIVGLLGLAADGEKESRTLAATPAGVAFQVKETANTLVPLVGTNKLSGSLVPNASDVNLGSATHTFNKVHATQVFCAGGVSEWFSCVLSEVPEGTLVSINDIAGAETKIRTQGSPVLGVATKSSGLSLSTPASTQNQIQVVLSGKTNVRVVGAVLKGQWLTHSEVDGVAKAVATWDSSCFGLALETSPDQHERLIACVVK